MSGSTAYKAIDEWRSQLIELADNIWENPEGPYREYNACKKTAELLEKAGFQVETGVGGVNTAIKASWGEGAPVLAFLGEYDALPGLSQEKHCTAQKAIDGLPYGHGCGHNLLGMAHVGAVIGLKEEMQEKGLKGTVVYYGCPAEEVLTGKAFMARGGAFDGIDAAFAFHPMNYNIVTTGNSLALNSAKFHFKGITAHAGGDPHNGRSALDAVEIMNVGANYLREHVTTDVRIHYVITEGGTAPNIVPDSACVWYYVRAPKRETVDEVYARLVKVAEGAAHMTETKMEIEFLGGCYQTLNNAVLAEVIHDALDEAPHDGWTEEEKKFAEELNNVTPENLANTQKMFGLSSDVQMHDSVPPILNIGNSGSTDVGDVSYIAPTITFYTACWNLGAPGHSWQVVSCSGASIGHKGTIYAAKAMAKAGLDLLEKPELLEKAKEEFKIKTDNKPYQCPIPMEVPVPQD